MNSWLSGLKELSPLVAVVVLFVWAMRHDKKSTIETMKTLSQYYVGPLQNSLESMASTLIEVQREDREEHREILKILSVLIDRVNGKPKP